LIQRTELNEDRERYLRRDRYARERPWNYNDPYERRSRPYDDYSRERFTGGRYGERADYDVDEPRYSGYPGGYREERYDRGSYERDYPAWRHRVYERPARSRVRCRDIMTRDLAVATRDTMLREVAIMMKDEDTGVIPVVEYQLSEGNGGATSENQRLNQANHNYGKLVGLITDRDIVLRAVAEDKECRTTRAEGIMTTDIYTARPNDRVVDVIRKMGDKQVRRIPVVGENGYLRGMISLGDVARETEEDQELAEALEDISKESTFWSRLFG
jgi:CBS domain-containing protein